MYNTSSIVVEDRMEHQQHHRMQHNNTMPVQQSPQPSPELDSGGVIVRYAVEVITPLEHLWEILIDKVKNPSRYDPQITAIQIVKETGNDQIERVITIGGTKMLRETIAIDSVTKTVLYKMVDDANFLGYVSNALYEDEETGIVTMEFVMNWTSKSPSAPCMSEEYASQVLRGVVNYTKDIAENEFLQLKSMPFAFDLDRAWQK